jgi:hypothetical protein
MQADRVDWTEDSDARLMQATLPRLAARPATDQVFFFFFFFFFCLFGSMSLQLLVKFMLIWRCLILS